MFRVDLRARSIHFADRGLVGHRLPGTVTLDGTTYTVVGTLAAPTSIDVRFSGTIAAPPVKDRASRTATAPFTLRGQFVHADSGGLIAERGADG